MVNGELWVSKEIYRREIIKLEFTTPEVQKDEEYNIVVNWLKKKVEELDRVCK